MARRYFGSDIIDIPGTPDDIERYRRDMAPVHAGVVTVVRAIIADAGDPRAVWVEVVAWLTRQAEHHSDKFAQAMAYAMIEVVQDETLSMVLPRTSNRRHAQIAASFRAAYPGVPVLPDDVDAYLSSYFEGHFVKIIRDAWTIIAEPKTDIGEAHMAMLRLYWAFAKVAPNSMAQLAAYATVLLALKPES